MPQTITEKIFSNHCRKQVYKDDFVVADLDLVMAHDTTCAWAIEPFYQITNKVWDKSKIFIPFDHAYPAPNLKISQLQAKVRKFAKEQGIQVTTDGVCHQIMSEKLINPGDLVLGADSHTTTGGALGALTIGVGSTDAALAMATGKCWFKVPRTIKIIINGKLNNGVWAKDVVLLIAREIGPEGGNYKVLEYCGETVKNFPVSQRLTLTNMSAEMGAKGAIVEPDTQTERYLDENNRPFKFDSKEIKSDKNATYDKILTINVSSLVPLIAKPHQIDNIVNVDEMEKERVKVDQVFIGSCTNCRIEDLEVVYKLWQGRELNSSTRIIITPASKRVYLQALAKGYIEFFTKVGAVVTNPGCGACLGRHGGVLSAGEVCISTSNRNFQGRMGSPKASIFLSSPATAAASSITGYITDPRRYVS